MAPSISYCIVCNDDDEDVVYKCKGNGGACSYQLCVGCVKSSFNDMSGAHSLFCALCKHPSALDMISAVCGKSAIQAVEQKFGKPCEIQQRQLVRNQMEKVKLMDGNDDSSNASWKTAKFLEKAKVDLSNAVRADRLSLLSNPEEYNTQRPVIRDSISPRGAVPNDYRLCLIPLEGDLYKIRLEHKGKIIKDTKAHFKTNLKVDALVNASQALQCAVIAFEGSAGLYQSSRAATPEGPLVGEDEVCISMKKINRDGNVIQDEVYLAQDYTIIGLNPNKRMIQLETHVQRTPNKKLMFEPLRHLIGVGAPRPVITELDIDIPESQSQLNDNQRKVAHPLKLKTAMEVAGPPGTGKTKTIVKLVRALLRCTSSDVHVLSERNGAINAIAEKFKKDSMRITGKKTEIIDLGEWMNVMAYGSAESMGESTKMFTVEKKIESHPEMTDLQEKRDLLEVASEKLLQALRRELCNILQSFGLRFDEEYNAAEQIREMKDEVFWSSPLGIIGAVEQATLDIKSLFDDSSKNSKYLSEEDVSKVVADHSMFLSRLVPIRIPKERDDTSNYPRNVRESATGLSFFFGLLSLILPIKKSDPLNKEATMRLRFILENFTRALKLQIFCSDNATQMYNENVVVSEAIQSLRQRLETELPDAARLHMSTIGSSHRLFPQDEDKDKSENCYRIFKDTICIFDESGCIPSYELLGLSRLGRSINALVLVGDKHQLPPYDPMQRMNCNRDKKFRYPRKERTEQTKMLSLLDASALTIGMGKVMLDTQYRVPRDIAEMLNARVYRGMYKTPATTNVPNSGLKMINVPWAESPRRKYVNPNEIDMGMNLLRQLKQDYEISSTLVITPYKKQQREFELQIKLSNDKGDKIETSVLTIDQCQGQEADAVILSLVRRPTRFLTINRLNVALSRVCKKLYVLTDFKDFQAASSDNKWECAGLASDMLVDFM